MMMILEVVLSGGISNILLDSDDNNKTVPQPIEFRDDIFNILLMLTGIELLLDKVQGAIDNIEDLSKEDYDDVEKRIYNAVGDIQVAHMKLVYINNSLMREG